MEYLNMKNKDAEYWFDKGNEFSKSENFEEAIKCYGEAARLESENVEIFNHWGAALFNLAEFKQDESLFRESFEKYAKAVKCNPKDARIFYNWGIALSSFAELKQDESLLRESFEKYAEAAKWNPKDAKIFNNWGAALSSLAKLKQDESLFREASEKYAETAKCNPKEARIFYNWGAVLSSLAKLKQDESLFRESFEKYAEAAKCNPEDVDIFISWGNILYRLSIIKRDESSCRESFEKYAKAASLEPSVNIFYNWGNALYYLAQNKEDEILFRESFEKYSKATSLEYNADVFNNWGNALASLNRIKKDESLFVEAFEKYDKAARLSPNDAYILSNWGNTLADMAKIKKDESLFRKAFEKYAEATYLEPNYANAFYNWGAALWFLAQINKQDESLFKEACEKYDKATSLNSKDVDAFYNWGTTLCSLAKLKNGEKSSFSEELKKFEKSSKNINDYDIFLVKGKLYFLLNQEDQTIKYFQLSRKDILEILTFLDEDSRELIMQTKKIYPILKNKHTTEGSFFIETIGIDNEKSDKYKEIYILSIFIISQLHVKNENEKLVAYYTNKTVSQKMLFENDKKEVSKFRLNAINYSNDPTEGETLLKYLFGKEYPKREKLNTGYGAFAGCFTFNYDSLNQFRLYGKEKGEEGTGLSLVFKGSFFSKEAKMAISKTKIDMRQLNVESNDLSKEIEDKYALFRCIYIDPITRRVETVGYKETYLFYREKESDENIEKKIEDYHNDIANIIKNVRDKMEELKELVKELDPVIVGKLLINLRYLIKHIAFKEEQECRIVKICHLSDKENVKTSDDFKQMYVEYLEVPSYVDKIYFGPKATGMELFQDTLTHKNIHIPCKKSTNQLA